MASAAASATWRLAADGLVLAAACVVGYGALAQDAIWGQDAYYLVTWLAHDRAHPVHLLYLPLVGALVQPLQALGCNLFESMRWCSGLGATAGVLGFWLAAYRLTGCRASARRVGWLSATAPGVVFFATVVEIHAVFLAFAGVVAWLAIGLVRRPGVVAAAVTGAATAAATLVHSTGHLLLGVVAAAVLHEVVRRRVPWAAALRAGAAAAATHTALVVIGGTALQPATVEAPLGGQLGFLAERYAEGFHWGLLPKVLLEEWGIGLFPVSLLFLAGFLRRRLVRGTVLLVCCVAVYTGFAAAVLIGTEERGAYFLPLVFPAGLLVVAACPLVVQRAAIALGIALAVTLVWNHDRGAVDDAFGRGVAAELDGGPGFVICGDSGEVDAILRVTPRTPAASAVRLALHFDSSGVPYEQGCVLFDAFVRDYMRTGSVFVTEAAWRRFAELGRPPWLARFADEYLRQRYTLREVSRPGFVATVLER